MTYEGLGVVVNGRTYSIRDDWGFRDWVALADIKAWILADAPGGGAPIGSILMWSDLNGSIPTGWALCDGTANNPGPDLRDRFIIASGTTHGVDTTGGSATLTHAGTAIGNHTVTQPDAHTTGVAHTHQIRRERSATTGAATTQIARTADTSSTIDETVFTESTGSASVTHSGTAVDAHSVTQPNDHTSVEPPYYALKFIQRMT